MNVRFTSRLGLAGLLISAWTFLGCVEGRSQPVAEKVQEDHEVIPPPAESTPKKGLDLETMRLFFPKLFEIDVPGYLPSNEIDELVKEVRPGMTVEQVSVALGIAPDDFQRLNEKEERHWKFRCTDMDGHGCFRDYNGKFNNGLLVEGTLWAYPF